MERSSGEGVGGRAVGGEGEGAGACLMVLSSSAGCEAVCADMLTGLTMPPNLN